MHQDKRRGSIRFLSDLASQVLCLQDALDTKSSQAMIHALRAVAQARGVDRLLRDAGNDRDALAALLDRVPAEDNSELVALLSRLVANLSASRSARRERKYDNK